jgi:hypothetical protein
LASIELMKHAWTEKLKFYLTNIWFLWGLCFLLNIITFLFIYFKIHPTEQTLALHYNVFVGVETYGAGKSLYYIPGVGLVISIVNLMVQRALKDSRNFLPFLTVFSSLCVQLILLAAALFLSRVN